ncbi:NADPH:quinone oxidoreductase [Cryobacterium roopkundense]|nr:NADPH:quinone oxidoreductase [Cryobacterium roopkundense]
MRAAAHTRYGPPSVLRLVETPTPVPRDDELLVTVFASTANRTDEGFLRGSPRIVRLFSGLTKPKKQILGNEFAGRVEAIGATVSTFRVGDRVFGYDGANFGGHAEAKTVRERGLVAVIPANMSYEEAAPGAEGAHYAVNLIRAARIGAGQRVLVNGSTGAIGSAAVQLLKDAGANVTAVCDTKNVGLVQSLGADRIIDYLREDFTDIDDAFDVIIDAVGKSSFRRCRALLKPRGIYLSSDLGFLAQNPILALTTPLFRRKRVMFPIPFDRKEDVLLLSDLMKSGKFRPVIDRTYPLDDIVAAFDYVETGTKVGNVVIRIREG